ncbi:hypothetical protein chiPu_0015600 [Chiloscyllium punctatum]|uniref:Uncharacterized protein n=1 Tax=Chiloscyllium punctatum TaxID=137246 RepID=A0A401T366_CHIPU|nr:hypothetical protein [Chiloscyllium punctatum]
MTFRRSPDGPAHLHLQFVPRSGTCLPFAKMDASHSRGHRTHLSKPLIGRYAEYLLSRWSLGYQSEPGLSCPPPTVVICRHAVDSVSHWLRLTSNTRQHSGLLTPLIGLREDITHPHWLVALSVISGCLLPLVVVLPRGGLSISLSDQHSTISTVS